LLGKKRVLELYLNVVEWGPGIYGAAYAAQAYFAKSPGELQPHEAAWLASILRSPRKAWTNQYQVNKPRHRLAEIVLQRMKHKGYLSEDEFEQAAGAEIVFAAKGTGQ
jgi:membrane peptidoglycan carboxypeptidase